MGCFNLSPAAYTAALEDCRSLGKPLLVLGGGGYNVPNVARCWAALTLAAARAPMPSDIPAHERFAFYMPDFRFALLPGYRRDENDEGYIARVRAAVAQAMGSLRARDQALSGSPESASQPDALGAEVARDAAFDQDACAHEGSALGSANGAEPRRAEPSDSIDAAARFAEAGASLFAGVAAEVEQLEAVAAAVAAPECAAAENPLSPPAESAHDSHGLSCAATERGRAAESRPACAAAALHRGCGHGAEDAGGAAAPALTPGCVDAGGCGVRCVARDALGASGWEKDLSAKAAPGWERVAKTARLGEPGSSFRAVKLVN